MSRSEHLRWMIVAPFLAASVHADVTLTPEQRASFGVQTQSLERQAVQRSWPATGQVLDGSTLVTTVAELRAARQALAASESDLRRNEALYQNDTGVARKVVEAARSQLAADQVRVATAEAQLRSAWGTQIAELPPQAVDRLVADLRGGKASLVRLDFMLAPTAGRLAPDVDLQALDDDSHWTGRVLGILPRVGGATLGGSMLVRVAGALVPGQVLSGGVSEARGSQTGYAIPASAIFQWQGAEWFYFEDADNHFTRHAVQSGATSSRGTRFVTLEEKGPLRVVSVGARSLLGVEAK